MLRQSSSRNYQRSKKLRPRHSFQAFLLFAVGVWVVYQLTRSYGKKRGAVVVETGDGNAVEEEARRRMGRKGLVGFAGRASSDDDVVARVGGVVDGVGSHGAEWGAASSDDDPLGETEEGGDGDDEEDQAADEDGGGGDGADDAIAGEEEEDDDGELLSQSGNGGDELKVAFDESDRATVFGNGDGDHDARLHEPKELNSSDVLRAKAKATGSNQDPASASQQRNVTDGAADDRTNATDLSDSTMKNEKLVTLPRNWWSTVSPSQVLEQRMKSTIPQSRIIV